MKSIYRVYQGGAGASTGCFEPPLEEGHCFHLSGEFVYEKFHVFLCNFEHRKHYILIGFSMVWFVLCDYVSCS